METLKPGSQRNANGNDSGFAHLGQQLSSSAPIVPGGGINRGAVENARTDGKICSQ
jgi:hypothetical protein